MRRIITGQDNRVARFVADRLGMHGNFGSCTSIGVEEGGKLIVGVVFTNYNGTNVFTHIASDCSRRWVSRHVLEFFGHYVFDQIKVRRVTSVIDDSNAASINFVEKVGYKLEARLEGAAAAGDLLVYRLKRDDFRYMRNENDV